LVCPHREGCGLKSCISNVPENERCCTKFDVCELRKVAEYVGMRADIPPYVPQGIPVVDDEPLFKRDYNLCIGCTRCVRICNEVRGVGALTFTTAEGSPIVGTTEPTLRESGCRFCGACVEVCPTGALVDKGIIWAEREKKLVPCKNACPVGMDVPSYISLIAEGNFTGAAAVVHESAPFPGTLGRVCFHPCEDKCRRAEVDQAVAIRELKRCAADYGYVLRRREVGVEKGTGKKVAIVGSGPAGMSCGYYLAEQGHAVTIFEALGHPGGMLRFGIPGYRLPRETLARDIEDIRQVGVEIKTNSRIESLDDIFAQGFGAIFLALGLQEGVKLGIEGEDFRELVDGVAFLREVNSGNSIDLGASVAVIGGGNVAIDAARTALRLGAKEVSVLYRRSAAEMPAYPEEVEQAMNEGIKIEFLVAPKKISKRDGKINVDCLRMNLGEIDHSGRRRPIPAEDSGFTVTYDNVIIAIGQKSNAPEGFNLSIGTTGYPEIDPRTLATSRRGVFAGGDMVSGASTVVDAIAMGKKGAKAIDQFLGGQGIIERRVMGRQRSMARLGGDYGVTDLKRVPIRMSNREEVIGSFQEVIGGYGTEQAIAEAKRCLRCDLRLQISSPDLPPEGWTEFNVKNVENVPRTEGVFQLFDADKRVIYIKGTTNLVEEMKDKLRTLENARYFSWEENAMYTKRESELLQQYMQQHGGVPEGNNELDDDLY
jgi:formate dehydrogenase beta subunit